MSSRQDLELMNGAIDMHVHAHPDVVPRVGDEIEIAESAKKLNMKALLFKSAAGPNAGRVQYVNKLIPELKSFGGVVLNPQVGGINPFAVESAIKLGAKAVWMPTTSSKAHIEYLNGGKVSFGYRMLARGKLPSGGLTIFDSDDVLLPEVHEILGAIKDANVLLCTGHLSRNEIFALIDEAVVKHYQNQRLSVHQKAVCL